MGEGQLEALVESKMNMEIGGFVISIADDFEMGKPPI